MVGRGFGRMWPAIVFVNDGLVRRERERERERDRGMGTQKVAAARLGMISAAVKHRREKMKRLGMSGWT